jgi:cellobiose phosphorylase
VRVSTPCRAFNGGSDEERANDAVKMSALSTFDRFVDFKTRFARSDVKGKYADEALPMRSELFSADQMEQHGKHLAVTYRLTSEFARDELLNRLADNERVLLEVCNLLTSAAAANRRITPAAEWLLDNFHLIEEQIGTAKRHLPKEYSRELPRLAHGPSAKLPRVYDLAYEAISHGDGRVDAESLSRFVAAHQTVSPLKLGELWAIPIMLRLALIENLRRVAVRIAASTIERNRADAWADQMITIAEQDPKSLVLVIADMARSSPPMVSSFVAEFARRLQGQSPSLALPLTWIEQRLSESGLTIEQLVHTETQEQASDQLSISNTVGSLRFLGSMDWREFVETMSIVERKLKEDPARCYASMDFASRDQYRHVVEEIAKGIPLSEEEVARKAIQLAHEKGARSGSDDREAHVGFYLIDRGRVLLERKVGKRAGAFDLLKRAASRAPLPLYLATLALITVVPTAALLATMRMAGTPDAELVLLGILLLLAMSQFAVAMVNWLATLFMPPCRLPRMDFSHGIPSELRTLVAVPTMLTSIEGIDDLVEALEVRFLANRDVHLHFALLTDFCDAAQENLPQDQALLDHAREGIEALNRKYPRELTDEGNVADDTFFLFHRPRRWNAQEQTWMGYERKRGKLGDLNAYLRGDPGDRFALVVGGTDVLSNVKFVITLDTDTELPRDSAKELVGAMAHPLNRARFDSTGEKGEDLVVEGYGILQPRVSDSLPGTNRSWHARLHGDNPGIDPYTRAVSDVYQDLFREGSFIGKGIYDVDAFERALKRRFPENRILSHDLVEGCYARSGLLSDVQIYEDYPARYSSDMRRRHRWIRGDWQLLDWLLPRVPGDSARPPRNPLSGLSLWKLFDNLRRSLVPAALTLLLILGWAGLAPPWYWTALVVGILCVPTLCALAVGVLRKPTNVLVRQHVAATGEAAGRNATQVIVGIAFMPYEAASNLDAIARTLWRMFISHRHLLEWTPAAKDVIPAVNAKGAASRAELARSLRTMWVAPVIAVAVATRLIEFTPATLVAAGPILLLWFVSPVIAWWVSKPLVRRESSLSHSEVVFLRTLARKTWAFFETFVGPEDQWLPPDNYQAHPVAVVAHRTSPTNMGLALLANLSAYDFGYIPAGTLIERTANAFSTMERMERYEGHFYNWYDTLTLRPLPPLYVSSVDSGNLAGYLMTLRPGLLRLPDERILDARTLEGMSDTLRALGHAASGIPSGPLTRLSRDLDSAYDSRPATLGALRQWLDRLEADVAELMSQLPGTDAGTKAALPVNDTAYWIEAAARQCRLARDELYFLAPWLLLPPWPKALGDIPFIEATPTLRELADADAKLVPGLEQRIAADASHEQAAWLTEAIRAIGEASARAKERMATIDALAEKASELAEVEYDFLYDRSRHLLTIGYNVADRRRDASYYDLLASEARFATFVAIAQGRLPQESWFALGRMLTAVGGESILLSWSGSMFEYLMPLLVMPTYEHTLLDQTCRMAVDRQIAYGNQRGVPWGISESGYNAVDANLNYQYRAFGVPGLGLKRGLAEDLVVAPYASALGLMVAPDRACPNLQRLAGDGLAGRFGLFEAIDYTPARLPRGQSSAVVRSFMTHHQGMTLLSLAHVLLGRPMQKRFESDPLFKATLLLLQERIPKASSFVLDTVDRSAVRGISATPESSVRVLSTPDAAQPEVQLLSNGRYHVMVSNAGAGSSRWKDLAVTRWREDGTCDNWGTFCYLRDVGSGQFWSSAHQPTLTRAERFEAIFSEARAEFRRRDHDIESHTEIVVSPEDDIELRRLRLINRSRVRRTIEVTSYAEVVLASPAADALHPGFSNLFVQTEIVAQRQAILCTRRPRSRNEHPPWMFHLMTAHGADPETVSYETDRMRFIGRGRTVAAPQAMTDADALSGTQGSVLDPIVAIRRRMTLEAQQSITVDIVTGVGETRDAAMNLVGKYQDRHLADRVFDLAWTHSWVTLRQINATESEAQLYGRLASSIIYANPALRAEASVLLKNRRGQSGLWSYAISGDLPIVLLQIGDAQNVDLVRRLVQAHAYWRLKGLAVDLVIWNEDRGGYRQVLQDQIMGLIASGMEAHVMDRPGGIFVRRAEQIADEDRILIQSVARAIITDRRGPLSEQIARRGLPDTKIARLTPTRVHRWVASRTSSPPRDLILNNGLGGFTRDGKEYVITVGPRQTTPVPWANVLANANFGSVISSAGVAYTWSENAHEFRLTPWGNDPVTDSAGEAFFVRDEETGYYFSPSPLPCRGAGAYTSRHGFGYSIFEHEEDGIGTELTVFVALDASVKFSMLKVRNTSGRPRRLSATGYLEWVLGDLRPKTAMHVTTEIDPATGAILARNPYNTEFAERVAFFDVDDASRTFSGDRVEFLGRNGTLRNPAAMTRLRLSGKVGAALDPCAAIQVSLALADNQEREIVFRLGAGTNLGDASGLLQKFRGTNAARDMLARVRAYWTRTLGAIELDTPDLPLNVLANGWLVYQTLACRVWARSGYYQSSGAYGFRDQIQDVMALVHTEPGLMREHLLRCASRQFVDGDVQHWWHLPSGRGVRTHCSDDYLWLPLATARYVKVTGDASVLDESLGFLEGRPVPAGEDSYYDMPSRAPDSAILYKHCTRAIVHGLRFGAHGLPLMGSGDWNDGLNLVGIEGKGESVWVGFFLCAVLREFADIARLRGDSAFADRCREEEAQLARNLEQHGWDGSWYRRAYFDDGTPLGSAANDECRIDSIVQSWSVLSGAGDSAHARAAMAAVDEHLVRREDALIQLLDPPFDKSNFDPGYIRGYVPGVRENGGQYTHAAIWATMAFAALGNRERTWELLRMLNPINHAQSPEGLATYKVEPYVIAADVYARAPHTGRGGWTWYTGSAGWMYRLIIESFLGLTREGNELRFAPCLPKEWSDVTIRYRYGDTIYQITLKQSSRADSVPSATKVTLDGAVQPGASLQLVDDRALHRVVVEITVGETIELEA